MEQTQELRQVVASAVREARPTGFRSWRDLEREIKGLSFDATSASPDQFDIDGDGSFAGVAQILASAPYVGFGGRTVCRGSLAFRARIFGKVDAGGSVLIDDIHIRADTTTRF